jgi:hypothetical protein
MDVARAPDEPPVFQADHRWRVPGRYADRIRPQDLDGMRSMAEGGEWQELVDVLLASLTMTQAPVTAAERDELRSLAEALELPTDQLTGLNVQAR